MRSKSFTLALVLLTATVALPAFAGKAGNGGVPLVASFSGIRSGQGVTGDQSYVNGEEGLLGCYFGVNSKNMVLVTYNTSRTLHFEFANSPAWLASGLPASFDANVDFDGINFWGPYTAQGDGTTAAVHVYLQFYVGRITYELDYKQLIGVTRLNATQWAFDSGSTSGFQGSPVADLNVIRRNSRYTYGSVTMPIKFTVTLK